MAYGREWCVLSGKLIQEMWERPLVCRLCGSRKSDHLVILHPHTGCLIIRYCSFFPARGYSLKYFVLSLSKNFTFLIFSILNLNLLNKFFIITSLKFKEEQDFYLLAITLAWILIPTCFIFDR